MLPSNEDVADGFIQAWTSAANGIIAASIPSTRVYYEVVAENVTWPNATILTSLQNIERTSSSQCIVKYEVTITAYVYDTDEGTLTAALMSGFEGNNAGMGLQMTIARTTNVIYVRTMRNGLTVSKELKQRKDAAELKTITAWYEVCLEGEL